MGFSLNEILSVGLVLFSVIDILGSVPIIIDLKRKGKIIEPFKASFISGILMIIFLVSGESILRLFGIDVGSFSIAGAIILFLIGMEMILGITLFRDSLEDSKSTVVPIAFPLIAGAGTMTTIISLKVEYLAINIFVGILLNIIFVYLILMSSSKIEKFLGNGGIAILRKVFGIILLSISIKLFKMNLDFLQ